MSETAFLIGDQVEHELRPDSAEVNGIIEIEGEPTYDLRWSDGTRWEKVSETELTRVPDNTRQSVEPDAKGGTMTETLETLIERQREIVAKCQQRLHEGSSAELERDRSLVLTQAVDKLSTLEAIKRDS